VAESVKQQGYIAQTTSFGQEMGKLGALQSLLGLSTPLEAARFRGSGSQITSGMAQRAGNNGKLGVIEWMRLLASLWMRRAGRLA